MKGYSINMKNKLFSVDYILLFLVLSLIIFGIISIGSATKINVYSTSDEFKSQILWFISGIFLMFITIIIDYRTICKFFWLIYILNIFLLILVLFVGSGDGVSRWLFGIQPSEFSKIFMIIFIATFINENYEDINSSKKLLSIFILTLFVMFLISKQPSLSESLVTGAILVFQLFYGGIDRGILKKFFIIITPIVLIVFIDLLSGKHIILGLILTDYQIQRIVSSMSFDLTTTDPSSYQTKNSVWAIGSGQLFGKGIYNGTVNQLNYLPESHNDFIFSVIGEEFGFIGCLFIIIIFTIIIARALYIASKAIDTLGMLLVVGVVGMIFFQTFVNIGVAIGILPNTGMPLPFLSYGGSSMWVNMIAMGLILNVGSTKPKKMFKG